ncbi:MAG: hypothetical protein A2Z20_06485 [Bdellovibrionales bacterium RBG_16_40_8]|nr:MAG: hypothetical protein A2Z20_06485 [Bdellovibrionales bacterium RBG_16_40_8]
MRLINKNLIPSTRFPILRRLLMFQFLLLIAGMALVIGVSFYSYRLKLTSATKLARDEIQVAVQPNVDKWLAWHLVGLEDSLNLDLEKFKSNYPIKEIKLIRNDTFNSQRQSHDLELALNPNETNSYLVTVTLDQVAISKKLQYAGELIPIIFILGIVFCLMLLYSQKYILENIHTPLIALAQQFKDYNNGIEIKSSNIKATGEIKQFALDITNLFKSTIELKTQAAGWEIAAQVAHDIRSPLTALGVIERELSSLPEEVRVLLRQSINRIRDIANELVAHNKKNTHVLTQKNELDDTRSQTLLSSVIESITSEKRLTFRHKVDIEIRSDFDSTAYGLFANVQPVELARIISNLVNNSIEALHDTGTIIIKLYRCQNNACIDVIDNGTGIPPEILAVIGDRGISFDKPEGSGLGLHHTKSKVQAWGGLFKINSTYGHGTTVTLSLPLCEPLRWFTPCINLDNIRTVVILDDDPSIHGLWNKRFIEYKHLNVVHLNTPDEFNSWISDSYSESFQTIFLCDYELKGFKTTGADLIKSANVIHRSTLVTSRFDDAKVQKLCAQDDIKLIPKVLAPIVPIICAKAGEQVSPKSTKAKYDAVLIDDDLLVHAVWQMAANDCKLNIVCYKSYQAFYSDRLNIDMTSPVYIDSDLGDDQRGENLIPQILEFGFINTFLTTGFEYSQFLDKPYIRVVGKEPPFKTIPTNTSAQIDRQGT